MKKFLKLVFVFIISLFGVTSVSAADSTVTYQERYLSNSVVTLPNAGSTYKTVTTSNGTRISYCFNMVKDSPKSGTTLRNIGTLQSSEQTYRIMYILENGYGGNWENNGLTGSYDNDQKFYITQLAIWMTQGSISKSTVEGYSSSNKVAKAALRLYERAAKYYKTDGQVKIALKGNTTMTLKGSNYVSGDIIVGVEGATTADVILLNAPAGSQIVVNGSSKGNTTSLAGGTKFQVSVPADKAKNGLSFKVYAKATGEAREIHIYKDPNNNGLQNIGLMFKTKQTVKAELTATITPAPKGSFEVVKVELKNGKEVKLSGAVLAVKDANGKEIARWNTSNENPKRFTNLKIGDTYTVYEVSAPNGYKKVGEQKVTISGSELQVVKVVNSKTTPTKISKQDATTGKELPGAHLVLKNSTGKVVDEWTSTTTPHYVENLVPGIYTLTETIAPEGYKLSTETVKFTVKADGTVDGDVIMYNSPDKKTKISKQDITTGKELPGAHLVLKDATGKVVDEWTSTTTPHYVTNLVPGIYTLSETIAPKGYKLSTETITFTVKADGSVDGDVIMYNSPNKGTKISKQDATTGKELPGAHLVLKDSNGKVIDEWTSTTVPHYVENLAPGTYTLSETIAPEGYALSTETVTFTVKADGTVDGDVIMYNKPTKGVYISKQDLTTKKELPGATLVLKDANGNIVDKWVSTTTPHFIPNLPEGTYTLIETYSPKGYGLSDEVITFEVKYDGKEMAPIVMYNSPIPDTGDVDIKLVIIGLIGTIGLGTYGFIKFKRA